MWSIWVKDKFFSHFCGLWTCLLSLVIWGFLCLWVDDRQTQLITSFLMDVHKVINTSGSIQWSLFCGDTWDSHIEKVIVSGIGHFYVARTWHCILTKGDVLRLESCCSPLTKKLGRIVRRGKNLENRGHMLHTNIILWTWFSSSGWSHSCTTMPYHWPEGELGYHWAVTKWSGNESMSELDL